MSVKQLITKKYSYSNCLYPSKTISLPRMVKRMNSIQKNISIWQSHKKLGYSQIIKSKSWKKILTTIQPQTLQHKISQNCNIPSITKIKSNEKYHQQNKQEHNNKISTLQKLQNNYYHLKKNLSQTKLLHLSKFTYPFHEKTQPQQQEIPLDKLSKQIEQTYQEQKKQFDINNQSSIFVNLITMKKDRHKIKQEVKKYKKIQMETINAQNQQRSKIIIEKRNKLREQRKNKMLQCKGLHWNVYYQMLALSSEEKQRLKLVNSPFVAMASYRE